MARNEEPLAKGSERRPWLLEKRSSTWFIILTVSSGVFTDMFLYGVIIPVIPHAIVSRAHVAPKDRQEWVTILLVTEALTYLLASPLFGLVADRTRSRRVPYLTGLALLALSLALQTAAHSTTLYVIGRALQGASAAAVWVIGLAIVCDTVDGASVGQWMGYVSLAMSMGSLMGPLLGGTVYEFGGYYAVFGMGFGVVGFDAMLRGVMIERKVAERWLLANKDPSEHQNAPPVLQVSASVASYSTNASLQPILKKEKSKRIGTGEQESGESQEKLTMLSLLKIPRLQFTLWASMIPTLVLAAFESTLPITVSDLFDWNTLGAGLIFIPLCLPTFLSPLTGALSDIYGCRLATTFGFLFMVPPLVCLRFVTHDSLSQKALLCVLLGLVGVLMSLVFAPTMAEVERIVAEKEDEILGEQEGAGEKGQCRATAYALFNMSYAAGMLCGPLVGGFVQKVGGLDMLGWVLALLCGVSAVSSFLMVGGWIGDRKKNSDVGTLHSSAIERR